ncbi:MULTISPECIES: hypothetical protein [unclassified Leptolyngbya]|uniref:hypothetical protein n=1 Tax=unclassified Leptolyngbya TaxID=2650499 RepID=UPI001688023D|nr:MULTISPECIES: hypothetical protein [unclassified Leptolyngbya]MBD1913416.1 hypothetical protein [Leptolyngbya sp. FACHB-8]MBD2155811.1 hypothetical protein [Leptolyngbya sp. FACHB-16]
MTSYKSRLSGQSLPFYIQLWNELKRFPKALHEGSQNPPTTSGPAAAFLISGGIGAVTMMVAHHLSDTSKAREAFLRTLGSWIPGSVSTDPMWGNIGSYAGKETMFLIGWLVSLAILYPTLKDKNVKPRTLFFWMLSLFTLATVMTWHPLFPYLPLH